MEPNNSSTHATQDLSEAINVFLKELPDPQRSNQSTIIDKFMVKEKEVLLRAQKHKGSSGMQWVVNPVKDGFLS